MLWIITEDLINNPPAEVGICDDDLAFSLDTTRVPKNQIKAQCADMTEEFRLLDGDDEVYFVGKCKDLDDQDGDSAFEPMDLMMNRYGCVSMEYRKIGETEWKLL